MASPPYSYNTAISPSYPSHAQLPQPPKRRQSDMPSSAPSMKRRKASMISTTSTSSAHPLRQTSFPPEQSSRSPAFSRSPSADTMVSSSVAGSSRPKKKKPSKKSKGGANDESSVVDGKSGTPAPAAGKKRRASNASLDDEEEGGGGSHTMALELTSGTKEEKARELEHRALLVRSLDPEQFRRYEAWRACRWPDAVIRRIVNQTLSQSSHPSVIGAVKSIAKIFAGELIEGARRVQDQWLENTREDQVNGLPSPPREEDGEPREVDTRRGPLLPDHLREALRRYKLAREGGLTGQLGLFQLQQQGGTERFGVRVKGRRLLK
ncbi:hypothetical protein HYFRA_00012754 [Hymenoscyphus fraxineus]|uniref:TAFII28-like protein domain-containing protein n=1 Tax=Hymenoscyphus fraxineus TaxID=746836 RepID=A0A9N9L4M1_9HELO|nr:hypothetical protein HYFRA_00012754 [Hymenoscyphus fraxineus]